MLVFFPFTLIVALCVTIMAAINGHLYVKNGDGLNLVAFIFTSVAAITVWGYVIINVTALAGNRKVVLAD